MEPMESIRSVALGVWVNTGSVREGQDEAGASHFIEHMVFKGTQTRSAARIAEESDAIGGDLEDETETTTENWTSSEDEDSDDDEDSDADDKTTKKTTKRTTRRTTQWDAQQAAEDFWNEVSKWAR